MRRLIVRYWNSASAKRMAHSHCQTVSSPAEMENHAELSYIATPMQPDDTNYHILSTVHYGSRLTSLHSELLALRITV